MIVGKSEEANQTVSLRYRTNEELRDVNFVEFSTKLVENIKVRNIDIKLF